MSTDAMNHSSPGSAGTVDERHRCIGSERTTAGIRIEVSPCFVPEQTHVPSGQYVFAYHIRITNEGDQTTTLLSRRWSIVDADGDVREVRGEGVVGHQPRLEPGEAFEYASFCTIRTRWGTMEGEYQMHRDDGSVFKAQIERFYLVTPPDFAGDEDDEDGESGFGSSGQ